MKLLKKIWNISFFKTFIFNVAYFCPFFSKNGSWKLLFSVPVIVSRNVQLGNLKGTLHVEPNNRIILGFGEIDNFDSKYERAKWNNHGQIVFHGKAHIGPGCRINNHGKIVFGKNFGVSANSTIDCDKSIVFGDDVLCSWEILIMDHDTHSIVNSLGKRLNENKSIIIHNHVWICCRCTLLKGTNVAEGCVVASGATISNACNEKNTIIGNFGNIIKRNINWCR